MYSHLQHHLSTPTNNIKKPPLFLPMSLEEKLLEKKRIAMVSSGGGLKAHFFHIGVGIRLEEAGLTFQGGLLEQEKTSLRPSGSPGNKNIDLYIGSSGGALFSIGVALGHSPYQLKELFLDDRLMKKVGLKRGIINYVGLNPQAVTELAKALPRALHNGFNPEMFTFMSPLHLGPLEQRLHHFLETEDFTKVAADLFIVTTPLNFPGRMAYCRLPKQEKEDIIYRNDANISAAVAASSSLQCFHPFLLRHHNGEQIDIVDGETRKTLSYKIASDHGADLVFVSYTHVPYTFNKNRGSLKKYGALRVLIQSVYLMIEQKIHASQELDHAGKAVYHLIDSNFAELKSQVPDNLVELIEEHRLDLLERVEQELGVKKNVDYVFIAPDKIDDEFYFEWHLGMSPAYINRIVRKGYEAADKALKNL